VFTNYQQNRNPFIDHPEWVEPAFAAELHISHLALPTSRFALSWPSVFTNVIPETATSLATTWTVLTNAATRSPERTGSLSCRPTSHQGCAVPTVTACARRPGY